MRYLQAFTEKDLLLDEKKKGIERLGLVCCFLSDVVWDAVCCL